MDKVVVKPSEAKPIEGKGYVLRNLVGPESVGSKNIRIGMNCVEAGRSTPCHVHQAEEAFFILKGSGDFRYGRTRHKVGPYDCIYVPGDIEHQFINTGTGPLEYLYMVSPPITIADVRVIEDAVV